MIVLEYHHFSKSNEKKKERKYTISGYPIRTSYTTLNSFNRPILIINSMPATGITKINETMSTFEELRVYSSH